MLKTISPTKSVPVQNPYFFNIMVNKIQHDFSTFSQAPRCESKQVSGLDGGPHEMLKEISPTESIPVQKPYFFNNMVNKSKQISDI